MLLALFIVLSLPCRAQRAQNNPYVDDKIFHFGFQLGINAGSFGITESKTPVTFRDGKTNTTLTDTLHARVSSILPGFRVGFVTDLRLCRYLNLRFTPGIEFASRTIQYKSSTYPDAQIEGTPGKYFSHIDVLSMPVDLPLFLKFSAEREGNYRPYVIAGGGVSFNVSRDKAKPVLLNMLDYFCQVGFGVDLYFPWFKLCPELTYRIGFADQLCPISQRSDNLSKENYFYSDALSHITTQCISLTFNFE